MDLTRLFGEKTYRVNLPPDKVFEEIRNNLRPNSVVESIVGCEQWLAPDKAKGSISYMLNPQYSYLVKFLSPFTDTRGIESKRKFEELSKKYHQNGDEIAAKEILNLRHEIPESLDIFVSNATVSSCVCHALCMPAIYTKISKRMVSINDLDEFTVQNAHFTSLRFLDQIFIGALNGEPIEEIPTLPQARLVTNASLTRDITNLVDDLLQKATGEVLICGWIGTRCVPKLRELVSKGVKVRIITHQPSDAKNQPFRDEVHEAFNLLCSYVGKENICADDNMHGRTIIVDNKALIGSMDLTSSSLTGPHTEFAIYTEQPESVLELRNLFNARFKPIVSTATN